MVEMRVRARVGETEDEKRVVRAVGNIFPGVELRNGEAGLRAGDLKNLKNKVSAKRIGRTVLGQLARNLHGGKTKLLFNRQAAFAGKVSLVETEEESPMGAIVLELNWDEGLVCWLTGAEKGRVAELSRHSGSSV
jgi:uncharacterized protein